MISLQTTVVTLAAVVLRWMLKDVLERFRWWRKDHAMVGRTLTYLVEVRHRLLVIAIVFEMLGNGLNLSNEDRITDNSILESLFHRRQVCMDGLKVTWLRSPVAGLRS